jgi:hypothetical protein
VPLPHQDQGFQQIGAAQEWAVGHGRATDHHMVAPTSAGMPPVDHEFVGPQATGARFVIDRLGRGDTIVPSMGGVDVHLDHAGIGGHADHVQARVIGGRIAFDMDGQVQFLRRQLCRGQQFQIILQRLARRHEQAQAAVAGFYGDGGAHSPFGRVHAHLRHLALAAGIVGFGRARLHMIARCFGRHGGDFRFFLCQPVKFGLHFSQARRVHAARVRYAWKSGSGPSGIEVSAG